MPEKLFVVDNPLEEFVVADNGSEIKGNYNALAYPSAATPAFILGVNEDISAIDAFWLIDNAEHRRVLKSRKDVLEIYDDHDMDGSAIKDFLRTYTDKTENGISQLVDKKEKEKKEMATANKPTSVKTMIMEDGQDAALRAAGKATSRFSRKLLLENLIPKIENPIIQTTAKKIIESSWGLSILNISFGYFYPAIESRIPMNENVRAFGNVVAQHMRRDGLSDVIVDLAAEIAGPIKEFLTEQMNMIPRDQLEKIIESQKVRAVDGDKAELSEGPSQMIEVAPLASIAANGAKRIPK